MESTFHPYVVMASSEQSHCSLLSHAPCRRGFPLTDLEGQFSIHIRDSSSGGKVAQPAQSVQQRGKILLGDATEQQILVILRGLVPRHFGYDVTL